MTPTRRLTRVMLGSALAGLVLLGACRDPGRTDSGVTLTVLHPDAPAIFGAGWPAKGLVFLPLVVRTTDGKAEGRLLRDWEHTDDYRRWTLHLRTGLAWDDGMPVTAHDVAFTLELLAHPAVLMLEPGSFRAHVVDDSTYTVDLLRPTTAGTARDFFTAVYPRHLLAALEPEGFWEWPFWSNPVGNGPYRVARFVPHTAVELVARDEHYRGRPEIDRVVLRLGRESGAALSSALPALLGGEVDAVPYVDPVELLSIRDHPEFETYHAIGPDRAIGFFWNSSVAPFDDPMVRRALSHAVDIPEVRAAMNIPAEIPLIGGPITEGLLRDGRVPGPPTFDPDLARALLDEAGWSDHDRDGIRERGDRSLRLSLLVSPVFGSARAGVVIQAQLARVGVALELETLEYALVRERLLEGDFDAVVINAFGQIATHVLLGADSPLGYRNVEVRAVVARIREAFDPAASDRLHVELAGLLREDPAGVFLYNPVFSTVARRRVRGLSSPWREDPLWITDELHFDGPGDG